MENEKPGWKQSDGTHCVVQTHIFLHEIQKLLKEGREVSIPVSGVSMFPCLQPGRDHVRLSPTSSVRLVPGMIVLFCRPNGDFVLHRIIQFREEELYLSGDGQCVIEGPVKSSCVLGWVSHVARHGRWHRLWNRTGFRYGVLWRWAFRWRRWFFALARRYKTGKSTYDRKCKRI